MSRPPAIVPPAFLHLQLPLEIKTQLALHLFSELEQRIPKGAYQAFFIQRLREYFEGRRLDLAPYVSSPPGACIVSGSAATIEQLERILRT